MPRSLIQIILEKKNNLVYPTSSQFYEELEKIEGICNQKLIDLNATETAGGIYDEIPEVRTRIKNDLDKVRKYIKEYKDYLWNDPEVQEYVVKIRKNIGELDSLLANARKKSLGDDDSLRIGNTYFQTAESLREKAREKILSIASIRSKDIESDRQRSSTDITENTEFDKDKMDIVGKKGELEKDADGNILSNAKNDAIRKIDKEREEKADKIRKGMFYYLAMILGQTESRIASKWQVTPENKITEEKAKANRVEMLIKAAPYVEAAYGKKYKNIDPNPFADKEYMLDLAVLASYNPGYKDYKPKEGDGKTEKEITEAQKTQIGKDIEEIKKEMIKLIDELIVGNKKGGDSKGIDLKKDKMVKEMEAAKKDLSAVAAKDSCSIGAQDSLSSAKDQMQTNINKHKAVLDPDFDIPRLEKIAVYIDDVFDYCAERKYEANMLKEKTPK